METNADIANFLEQIFYMLVIAIVFVTLVSTLKKNKKSLTFNVVKDILEFNELHIHDVFHKGDRHFIVTLTCQFVVVTYEYSYSFNSIIEKIVISSPRHQGKLGLHLRDHQLETINSISKKDREEQNNYGKYYDIANEVRNVAREVIGKNG